VELKGVASMTKSGPSQVDSLGSYLKALARQYKSYFIGLVTLALLASMFKVTVDFKVKEIIDTISSNPSASVSTLLILFVIYKLLHHGMFFIQRLLNVKFAPKLLAESVSSIYQKSVEHSLHWFDSHLSGEISSKIFDFQNSIGIIINASFRAFNNMFTIIIGMIFLLRVNTLSALVIFLFVLIYTPVLAILLKKQMRIQKQFVSAGQEAKGVINDSVANIFGIKIIGNIASEFRLKLIPAITRWKDWNRKTLFFDAIYVDNADTLLVTTMATAQIFLSAYLYQHHIITAGDFAFISIVTLTIRSELDNFLESVLFTLNPALAAMKASYGFISAAKDTQDMTDAKSMPRVTGDIKIEDLCFSYGDDSAQVISGLNLHIPAGQRLGIVGTSGAGKTTLIKCLLRYFDIQQGKILFDDMNIAEYTQESLRANISLIPQDITMFHRTIFENLQLAKEDATLEEVIEACKKARVHEDILRMPGAYDSIVGERGVKVSGGQRQRIAIARAILKNAPILILDEATSALDTPTEQLIQESLNELLDNNHLTNIVVAHRLSTLQHMDRILVLERGKIIEEGSHQDLLALNGLYKRLWDAQVGGFIPE
jgi:ATP-binding cassette subfamily B protein